MYIRVNNIILGHKPIQTSQNIPLTKGKKWILSTREEHLKDKINFSVKKKKDFRQELIPV